ncbi:MAG: hypothetical protein H6711_33080 [Myxococcales bacterium]|nr:hypothetical protein [Myxococcales bacterium]
MLLAIVAVALGCTAAGRPEAVVERREDLDASVGKTITLIGVQSRTKQPMVLGVDVDGDYKLSDRRVQATGVLVRWTAEPPTDPDEIAKAEARAQTSRGYGTFYRLVDPARGDLARTEPAPSGR